MGVKQHPTPRTIQWIADDPGFIRLIDQTQLPTHLAHCDCRTVEQVWEAIKQLRVRGAPAIGIAAALGVPLGMQTHADHAATGYLKRVREICDHLRTSRPTAVNLFWALERMQRCSERLVGFADRIDSRAVTQGLLQEALAIEEEDRQMCYAIGRAGADLIADGNGVLTHCNAGGLATADYGTALAVMFAAAEQGRTFRVFADETRPLLQGARLTTWELKQRGIPVTLICDNMAAQVMKEGRAHLAITGADRIAANGDTANKIGTYGLALLARAHNIPFYVAAPSSTFDLAISSGEQIPIEQRDPQEITHGLGRQCAPDGIDVYNPAFDVTPAELIAAIITEKGVIRPVNEANIRRVLAQSRDA